MYRSTILPIIDYNDHFQGLWNLESGVLELKYRRILHLLSIMYYRSKNDMYLDKREIHTRQFQKIKFLVITPNITVAFKSVNYLGAQLWDKLSLDTQTAGSYSEFKYKVKRELNTGMFN